MNRRDFTRTLAVGAGASTLYSPYSYSAARSLPPEDKLGIALVGLGGYSTGQLGPALQETKNCYLAGVVTGTPEKEKTWADKYGIPEKNIYNYDTFDRVADNEDIDIIYVVLPNSMHAEYTIRAAEAGKHVICEKPMAISVEECRQMIEACEKAGVKLSIGYRLHFEPHNQKVMQMANQNSMGEINFIRSGAGYRMGDNWEQWRLKKDLAGTGALGNMGVYAIQGALYSAGENPVYVRAQEYKTMPEKFAEVDETVTFQFEFPSGAVANCETSHNASMNYLYVSADQGWIQLDPFSPYGGIKGTTSDGPMQLPQVNQQARQMDDFAACIMNNEKTPVPGEMGMRDVQIIDCILRSIKAGGEKVQLNDLAF